ncbi:MAG: dihydroneopterin aldolase [Spirochaetales bacterium]|nr:dihydroneopterin aldolase [Spirochaetales bacterium]
MNKSDKIILKNLSFYSFHGNLPEEKQLGQKFFIDLEICTNLRTAGGSDNVADTINYALAYENVKSIVENKNFNLIEALAEEIAQSTLHNFETAKGVTVRVRKPQAPVNGIFDYFEVEITRERNEYN